MTCNMFSHQSDTIPIRAEHATHNDFDLCVLRLLDNMGNSFELTLTPKHRRASLVAIHEALGKLIDFDTLQGLEAEAAAVLGGATVTGPYEAGKEEAA